MDQKKDLLYHDLPSIKPRISRNEWRSLSRNQGCIDCTPEHSIKKNVAKKMYRYHFILIIICVFALQFLQQRKSKDEISIKNEPTKTLTISLSKKIEMILIDQPNRYGIYLLFRNSGNDSWNIKETQLSIKKQNITDNITIDTLLKKDQFHSVFVPLSEVVDSLNDIEVSIKP